MQTKVQNMHKYVGYIKCGEILRPPCASSQRPYIIKCFHCKEIYLLFEAFIFHIEDHCKSFAEARANDYIPEVAGTVSSQVQRVVGVKNVKVKLEESLNSIPTIDRLVETKPEYFTQSEYCSVKEELSPSDNNINNPLSNDDEVNLASEEELCEKDEGDYKCSDEETENSSGGITSDEDDKVMIDKLPKTELEYSWKPSFSINKFLKNKELVNSFIELYKNQPSLWNKNLVSFRQKAKRQKCFKKIADELNKHHDLSISWNQVAGIVALLCRKYREDLKGLKEINESSENYTPYWFFEDLHFLKPFVENNRIVKLDSHLPDLLPHQIMEILKIYKGYPHIWNTEMIEHYCQNKVDAAKQKMLQDLETKLDIKITENILESYFRTIHYCFTQAKRNKLQKKSYKNNSDTLQEDNIQEDYYEYMTFLNGHVGSFRCSECERSFKSPIYLKIHQTNAHGFEPLPCSQCQKPFRSVTAYTNHAKHHVEDHIHECNECGKKFLDSTELRIHMRNHTGVKQFCCEGFTSHYKRHKKSYLHICKICNKGFYSKYRYNDHLKSHSNTRFQVCNMCDKTFITKRALQEHVVMHDEFRKHACKLCGKAFKNKPGVSQHMRTHAIAKSEEKSITKKK